MLYALCFAHFAYHFQNNFQAAKLKKRIHNFVIIQTIHNRLLTERDHIISITTVPST